MIAAIDRQKDRLEALCRQHRVQRLEVFGSAADGTFDAARSDIDFLVEYLPLRPGEHYEACFGLIEDLERLLGDTSTLSTPRVFGIRFSSKVSTNRELCYMKHDPKKYLTDMLDSFVETPFSVKSPPLVIAPGPLFPAIWGSYG